MRNKCEKNVLLCTFIVQSRAPLPSGQKFCAVSIFCIICIAPGDGLLRASLAPWKLDLDDAISAWPLKGGKVLLGDLWMWIQVVRLQFEVVRGPVGVV